MTSDSQDLLLHREEATAVLDSLEDRTTYQLLGMATTEVALTIAQHRAVPASPFDLLFFVRVMKRICERHHELRSILSVNKDQV